MTIYFDRTKPFYLGREAGFYSTPVEVDETSMKNIEQFRALLEEMEGRIHRSGAPENFDQALAEYYVSEIRKLFKTRKQIN